MPSWINVIDTSLWQFYLQAYQTMEYVWVSTGIHVTKHVKFNMMEKVRLNCQEVELIFCKGVFTRNEICSTTDIQPVIV